MSNMLEQAIVDAAALKEAALKNAEHAILEKYAPEIKSAVDQLLTEQPEDEELGLFPEEPGVESPMGGEEGGEEEELSDLDADPAYAEGEKLCRTGCRRRRNGRPRRCRSRAPRRCDDGS